MDRIRNDQAKVMHFFRNMLYAQNVLLQVCEIA